MEQLNKVRVWCTGWNRIRLSYEELLNNNIENILGGYENGMNDYPEDYPQLTEKQVLEYVKSELYDMVCDGEGFTGYGEGIAKELRFIGQEIIDSTILSYARDFGVIGA